MFLYKASGATYLRVVNQELHAFPFAPKEASEDEFILLSKNREDCRLLEKQVQHGAKLQSVRPATDAELASWFPGVDAGDRWRFALKLYWVRKFRRPFNLTEVRGLDAKRYATVQGFAKLDEGDELAVLRHLIATNADLVLDVINTAERPSGASSRRMSSARLTREELYEQVCREPMRTLAQRYNISDCRLGISYTPCFSES